MEHDVQPYRVYIYTDDANRITAIDSSEFLTSTNGWVLIDEGYGDRYHHAQGNYLPGPLMDERGVYRYKLVDGAVVERTAEEMDADYTPPISPTTDSDARIAALEDQVAKQTEMLAAYEAAYTEGVNEA